MAPPHGQGPWQYDHSLRLWYWRDQLGERYVYENGSQAPFAGQQQRTDDESGRRTLPLLQQSHSPASQNSRLSHQQTAFNPVFPPPYAPSVQIQLPLSGHSTSSSQKPPLRVIKEEIEATYAPLQRLSIGDSIDARATVAARRRVSFHDTQYIAERPATRNSTAQQQTETVPHNHASNQFLQVRRNSVRASDLSSSGGQHSLMDRQALSQMHLNSTELTSEYRPASKPKRFFSEGRVFATLWNEAGRNQADGNQADDVTVTSKAWSFNSFGEPVHSKIRRFIVVREGPLSCIAVPISTYNGKGVAKTGIRKSDHAIVYIGKLLPPLGAGEAASRAGELPMLPKAIRINGDLAQKLDSMSRVDFASPQTIHHYVKIKSIGVVHPDSFADLIFQFRLVMGEGTSSKAPGRPAGVITSSVTQTIPSLHKRKSSYHAALEKLMEHRKITIDEAKAILGPEWQDDS